MSTVEKNRFSELLEQLINMSEVKNASIAKALQYDASYISKWISGRMMPAEKTKKKVLTGISHEIVRQSTQDGLENLYSNYQVTFPEELEKVIYDNLEIEYDYVMDLQKTCGTSIAPKVNFFVELSSAQYITKMRHPVLRRVKMLHIMAEMDLLLLNHEYRLQIMQGDIHRELHHTYPDVHFSLVIDLSEDKIDDIYDPIFLMNMLSAMSQVDFHLYKNIQASGKMVFTVKDDFMISGMLVDPNKCMSVTVSSDPANCNAIFYNIRDLCTREALLCRRETMEKMIVHYDYMHSMLSLNQRWVIGHMTEHFLPEDLFEELLEKVKQQKGKEFRYEKEIRYVHTLTRKALEEARFDILIYSQAFLNLAVESELDFFDYKIRLTLQQRERYIGHLLKLCSEQKNLRFKLIYKQLMPDFQYHVNQCVFLSDQFSYLRLSTYNGHNNLAVLNHPDMQRIFDRFFDIMWDDKNEDILSDSDQIYSFICHMIQRVNIISEI